ncbi:related to VPS62 Vacuolar Protein Sorting [Rhynchosporium agropyri]|uniref:Related to VPS62 Vacuolar Protein Sorting n=1 Tax=Rhynchosporium agropyri TaxID=914238 RepID=A0A1E1KHA2_9HELO|nr:related to VPS62 Vacuolar Protein Sorting [Rhynchosporium agropyri]
MWGLRRLGLFVLFIILSWVGLTALHKHLDPNNRTPAQVREDAYWISTSKNWLDRQACRWIGLCGLAHWHPDPAVRPWNKKRGDKRQGRDVQYVLNEGENGRDGQDGEDDDDRDLWDRIPGQGQRLKPGDWDGDTRVLKEVPQFVLDHAPLVHLYSDEQFWPSDIREHLAHVMPYNNMTDLNNTGFRPTVDNLHELNEGRKGAFVFLHSKDDVEERPEWLGSAYNKPVPYDDEDEDGEGENEDKEEDVPLDEISTGAVPSEEDLETWFDPYGPKHKISAPIPPTYQSQPQTANKTPPKKSSKEPYREALRRRSPILQKPGGYSPAPAVLVLVDKGSGILDAFWFYFYSYNLGTTVLGCRFGNHVGDWEHSLIRFHNGVPKAVFFSAHSGGLAYTYSAVEKGKGKGREGRPVLYSALGSHAMYAQPGSHPYVLPFGLLGDVTDRGPMWDPAHNYLAYHYNTSITHGADAKAFPEPSTDSNVPPPSSYSLQPSEPSLQRATNPSTLQMASALQPAANNPDAPMGWWWFAGHWGDKLYSLGDWRQWRFVGEYHYVSGPFGPRWKNLGRSKVCQSRGGCMIVDSLREGKGRSWLS